MPNPTLSKMYEEIEITGKHQADLFLAVGGGLTMAEPSSEMNAGAVITNRKRASRIANQNPQGHEARSNIMWTAAWELNTLASRGKSMDWMVHMLGQAVGGYTGTTRGMTLSAVSLPYYRYIMPYGLSKFKRFAVNVWDVSPEGKSDQQIAKEGLAAMENWMKELGLVMNITELGINEDMIEGIADVTAVLPGGYSLGYIGYRCNA